MRKLSIAAGVAGATAGVAVAGATRWHVRSAQLTRSLTDAASAPEAVVQLDGLASLPTPVIRYFQRSLTDGQRHVRAAHLVQHGGFFAKGAWRSMDARQVFTVHDPGFVWDARITMAPLMRTYVRDSYVHGEAAMHAELMALFPLVDQTHRAELNAGALMRLLGEMAWFPTALLPGNGVTWTPMDAGRARATLADNGTTVSLEFTFDERGDILEMFAPDRFAEANGAFVKRPWRVQTLATGDRDGMRIPLRSRVEWLMPDGPMPYWRGEVSRINYHY